MSSRWVLLPSARSDIDEIASFIARDNLPAAHRFIERALDSIETVADNPGFGTKLPSSPKWEIRRWRVTGFNSYVIIYRRVTTGIRVLRIVHGARDLKNILADLHDT